MSSYVPLKIEHTLRFCPKCGTDLAKRLHDGDRAANTPIADPCIMAAGVMECVACNLSFSLQIQSAVIKRDVHSEE